MAFKMKNSPYKSWFGDKFKKFAGSGVGKVLMGPAAAVGGALGVNTDVSGGEQDPNAAVQAAGAGAMATQSGYNPMMKKSSSGFKMKGFKAHDMYNKKRAKTHKEHLALKQKGYKH